VSAGSANGDKVTRMPSSSSPANSTARSARQTIATVWATGSRRRASRPKAAAAGWPSSSLMARLERLLRCHLRLKRNRSRRPHRSRRQLGTTDPPSRPRSGRTGASSSTGVLRNPGPPRSSPISAARWRMSRWHERVSAPQRHRT
jgi:hypothetical protein